MLLALLFCVSQSTLWQVGIHGGLAIPTEFFVEVNGVPHKAVAEFATPGGLSFVERWRETLGANPEPIQWEAADLAKLARDRYLADSGVGQLYIGATADVKTYIEREPLCEIGGFILLKCTWFAESEVIGLCHFRRTWCNHIVVDYLAKHPLTLGSKRQDQHKVKGIGPALLSFLCQIAVEHSCPLLWGEATQISWEFYVKQFSLREVKDLFVVSTEAIAKCAEGKLEWKKEIGVNKINMEAVQELYEAEEKNPPLVGNRSLMVGPRRQLINHFYDLSRSLQDEVAQAVGLLQEGDHDILEDDWCRILFQRAFQEGKLRELWTEVEKRHEFGEPDKNPF